jgi:pimeloyl-ACP methyl ester carboxylesterase
MSTLSKRNRRRALRITACFSLIVTLLAAGCSAPTVNRQESSSAPSTPAAVGPLPIGPYAYSDAPCPDPLIEGLQIPPLGADFSCGRLTVPEDRSKAEGKQISIAVARLKSSNSAPKPEPLLMLSGGPGGTGLVDAVVAYGQLNLNRDREVIFIDQRGTLHSDPFLGCPEIDTFTQQAVAWTTADAETERKDLAAVAACRQRLTGQGIDLRMFDTAENSADLAALRLALNIPAWHVYGVSYGTDLALQYLRNYPDGIVSEVLDSVVPPNMSLIKSFWNSAASGFQELSAACSAQPACVQMLPDLEATLTTVVNDLNARPRTIKVTLPNGQSVSAVIDGYKFANLVETRSLVPGGYDDIPAIIAAAAKGNVRPAATAIAAAAQPTPSPAVGYGLAFGVFCRESIAYTTKEAVFAAGKQALPNFPDQVLEFTLQTPRFFADCGVWDIGKAPDLSQQPAQSSVPVLILTGQLDAVTAPSNAEFAVPILPNSTVLKFPDSAHGVLTWSSCGPATVTGFINDPRKGYRPTCLTGLKSPTFATKTN